MSRRLFRKGGELLFTSGMATLTALMIAMPPRCPAQARGTGEKGIQRDQVIAGGPKDFMEVHHLVLKGTNEEIGHALATIARRRFQAKPEASTDRFRTRVQRRYIKEHFPILFERMRGVAANFGQRFDDDAWNFASLPYADAHSGGCSVVYYPPGVTAAGVGVVSRNLDYSTGDAEGKKPRRGEMPLYARPYLIEMHPDRGYPSLALCNHDLLSGVLDGINSEGLTVALLDDVEVEIPGEGTWGGAVGLDELQMLRLLLDTCATVAQAKEALLMTKQYYYAGPVHYLIADRHGGAFVWEFSQTRNLENLIENPGKPLISTNFSLHLHLDKDKPPSAKQAKRVCPRYCALAEGIAAEHGKLSLDFIKKNHKAVDATGPARKGAALDRTMWHALYFPQQRKVQVSFYLGEKLSPERPAQTRIRRSAYLEFVLKTTQAIKE
jgi:Acyl-coenzyme A:6-aminopenicillanic acid acyl-transferase